MSVFGYARVLTDGQTLTAQLEALRAAGCTRIFREKIGGAATDRAQLRRAIDQLAPGDVLVVTRLDRLARSTRDLLNILDAIAGKGAGFRSLGDTWADSTAPYGRKMITVVKGLAEFEREMIRARTGEGRQRAKARGQHLGRPPTLTSHQRSEAVKALEDGTATQADLARRFAVSQSTISRLAGKVADTLTRPPVPHIDADTERAARVFLKRIKDKYPFSDAILYGSRARGDHTPDSDADIAVVLREGTPDKEARTDAALDWAGIAFHILMETGIKVSGFPVWPNELAHPETFSNPALIDSILRDGIHL
jgi:DNA invertase Pin-like site-specific DNA recombinase/predicted nucleotidyltransferase